jgi:hypothetical protein
MMVLSSPSELMSWTELSRPTVRGKPRGGTGPCPAREVPDDCGSDTGCRSRPRTLAERYLLPLFLMRPVRCTECFRRDYRLILVPVKDRLPLPRGKQPSAAVPANRNSNVA